LLHDLQLVALDRVERAHLQQLDAAKHAIQRRANLVAHRREKSGLCPIRRIRIMDGLEQRGFALPGGGHVVHGAELRRLA
jgi:hypothetical protein